VEVRHNYDAMDRLVEQAVSAPPSPGASARTLLSKRTWKYDAAGRVHQIDDSRWGTTQYKYDRLGQLAEAKRGKLHEVFEYQANGSLELALNALDPRTSATGPGRWDLQEGNVLTRTDKHSYEYDDCHRRVAKTDRKTGERAQYIWDCRDRLREVRFPDGKRARYFYDAFGRRVRKEIHPAPWAAESVMAASTPRITEFLWDGDELAAELDSETGERGHVHYPGTFVPLMQVQGGQIYFVVTDHLGTPKDLVAGDGSVRWSAGYTAWGRVHEEFIADQQSPRGPPGPDEPTPDEFATVTVCSPFRLLGQYYDEETTLAATRFRYWDAETGRWASPDPLGFWGGRNLGGFNGAPTTSVDPFGLAPCKVTVPPDPPGLPPNVTIQPGEYTQSEIDAAIHMGNLRPASSVTLRPPTGTRAATGATSDLVIDGVNYDVYTPTTGNAGRVVGGILDKNNQAQGVVVDLRQTTVASTDLGNVPARLQGAINAQNAKNGTTKTLNIQDVVFLE
jgi:RHS repeat-associated protein